MTLKSEEKYGGNKPEVGQFFRKKYRTSLSRFFQLHRRNEFPSLYLNSFTLLLFEISVNSTHDGDKS